MNYNKNDASGVTGICVLSESHASLHTFPEFEKPFISIDLYSCKPFDVDKIVKFTTDYWGALRTDYTVFNRFVGQPQTIAQGLQCTQ